METAEMSSQFPPASTAQRPEAPRPTRDPSPSRRTASTARRLPLWALVAAGAALVVAIVIAAVLLLGSDDNAAKTEVGKPRIVTADELSAYARSGNHTVYWAGAAAPGFKLELTEVKGPRVFVRYLTSAAKAGDPRAAYTTVATYPMKNAFARVRAAGTRNGAVAGQAPGGATLYYKKTPSNVYVARPGSDYLVEVFAPQPKAALQLASSASLVQVR
jgi:hypothetical protein